MADNKDEIQARMLENISDEYDKTKGSFFYDALKPVAIEMEKAYKNQDEILNNGFAETAMTDYLDKKVAEQGLIRKSATKANTIVKISGSQGFSINIGDKVASETVNFIVIENKTIPLDGFVDVAVECEVAGTIGNVPANTIQYFPITLAGLDSVTNLTPVTNGYNAETDEELRQRFFEKVRTPATSGNKYHYINWAKEVIGVGDAKVFPLWNGNGTVKVVIIDSNKKAAGQVLIESVTNHIEEVRPIGANVTVASAIEKEIDVTATVILANGYTIQQVQELYEIAIIEYLKTIAFVDSYVSYAQLGKILLETPGVGDYSGLLINNTAINITLADEEVPVLGIVSLVV